jgi:Helix-turn-helix of DDE superfamily endonuclease
MVVDLVWADLGVAQRPRQRAAGAAAKYTLVFVDRLLVTMVQLRHAATHDVLAAWFQVARSTITRAVVGSGLSQRWSPISITPSRPG